MSATETAKTGSLGRDAKRHGAWLLPLASLGALLLVWALAAWLADQPRLLPGPIPVMARLVEEARGEELFYHLGMTLARVAAAFLVAMSLGTVIGVVMGRSYVVNVVGEPWLLFLLNLPALVVIVLCYLWIGLGETAAITAVSLNKIPNVAVTLREGARALDPKLLDMARVFAVKRRRVLLDIVLPQLWPYLAAAARSGLALIWKIVLVVELLGRSNGVGFQIALFFQLFDVAGILAYALAFIAIVQAIEWGLLQPFERRVTAWRR